LDDKAIKRLDITRDTLKTYAKEFKTQAALATKIRKENDLAADTYVSDRFAAAHFEKTTTPTVVAAANRFKQLGSVAKETQHDLPSQWGAAAPVLGRRLARQERKTDELGGKIDAQAGKIDALAIKLDQLGRLLEGLAPEYARVASP
jgi:hypothetical protein